MGSLRSANWRRRRARTRQGTRHDGAGSAGTGVARLSGRALGSAGLLWLLFAGGLVGGCAGGSAGTGETLLDAGDSAGDGAVSEDAGATPDASDALGDASACSSSGDCASPSNLGPCERMTCVAGLCERAPREHGSPCDDEDRCTLGTRCTEQGCVGGTALSCVDANPCTRDLCDGLIGCKFEPQPEGAACDDGDPCSVEDRCEAGLCAGDPDPVCACEIDEDCAQFDADDLCAGRLICEAGACRIDAATVVACPPAGPCRANLCEPTTGECAAVLLGDDATCDDSNPCTSGDRCAAGACVGSTGGCPCAVDTDCGGYVGAGYDFCQGPLRCIGGACAPDGVQAVTCLGGADGGCLTEACDPATGLCASVARPDGTGCESAVACAPAGTCAKGVCATGAPDCDDLNPCTVDSCAGEAGCQHLPVAGGCDDGDPCTAGETCASGLCVPGAPLACDDLESCTADVCDPVAGGCVFSPLPDGAACQGADLCLGGGACLAGYCAGEAPVGCAVPGPCAQALCKPDTGCTVKSLPDGAPCDDGDTCTQPGQCSGGACETLPVSCKDGNPCTVDACDSAAGGCLHLAAPDGSPCDPPSPCVIAGACKDGQCAGGEPVQCPAIPCREAICDESTGACVAGASAPDGSACDSGPCNLGETCAAGACGGGKPVDCDDGDACTLDTCAPSTGGCEHAPKQCPEPAGDACRDASCAGPKGCGSSPSPLCLDGVVLFATSFPCDSSAQWTVAPSTGPPVLAVQPMTGPSWDGDCSLGAQVPPDAAGPWETSALTSAWASGGGVAGPATVRVTFVEFWDAKPSTAPFELTLELTAAGSTVAETALPQPQPLTAGTWQKRQAFLPLPAGTKADGLRVRLAGSSKTGPMTWRIDKLVAVSLEMPAP
jgi:hypothetical protein